MSPTRLLLEGPDLPTLLEEIRMEYGTRARIVQAEKVRRGGIGGFFARERFNIQVEVPELPVGPKRAPGRGGSPVRSVMDLVDKLNREEEALHQGVMVGAVAALAALPAAVPAAVSEYGPPTHSSPSTPPASPPSVSVIRSSTGSSTGSSAPVSTQSAAFADVMSRLQQGIEPPALAATQPSWGVGTHAVAEARHPPELALAPESALAAQLSFAPQSALAPQPPSPPELALVPSEPVHVPSEPVQAPLRTSSHNPFPTGAQMAARATRMGVPAHVFAGVQDPADVYRRLMIWVESRPAAPMILASAGQVVVVVGEIPSSMGVATSLAREFAVDPAGIYLAVSASSLGHDVPVGRLLSDISDIAMRRQRWQQSVGSTIVVVEAALPPTARGWLSAVVSALAPTFTWGVAQASTKIDDVVYWASEVGQVDALALVNVPSTGDPAAALAGPLAVGLLDGQRATVTRWMAMLTDGGERR